MPFVTPGDKAAAGQRKGETHSVVIDGRAPVAVPRKSSVQVLLARAGDHTVRVLQHGMPAVVLRFSFANKQADHLCLWFDVGEDEWKLDPLDEAGGKCGCDPDQDSGKA